MNDDDRRRRLMQAIANIRRSSVGNLFCRICGHPSSAHKIRAGTRMTSDKNNVVTYPKYDCDQCTKVCVIPKGKTPWITNRPPDRKNEEFPGRKL